MLNIDNVKFDLQINAPFVQHYLSTLGGFANRSLMMTISIDPRTDWENGILQNSRYAHFSIDANGVVENFSGSLPKFRKCTVDSADKLVAKLNAWIAKVSK